jgi:hypothetical protein
VTATLRAGPPWQTLGVPKIHIRVADGGVHRLNALKYEVKDQILMVQVKVDADHSDFVYFSPSYWQQYVVNPHSRDPLEVEGE